MAPERLKVLMLAAADAFEEQRDPFQPEWLSEHSVTIYECGELCQEIADALRWRVE